MLLILLAQATAIQAPAPSSRTAIFSYDDYPRKALANGWQGTVRAELTIDVDGKVTACRVIQSSGHAVLDEATCDLLTRRARFEPARDANGKPVVDTYQTPPIEWKIRSLEPRRSR